MSVSAWRFSSSWAPLRRSCSAGQAGVRDGAVSQQGCRCGRGKGCLGSSWLPVLSHAAAGSAASSLQCRTGQQCLLLAACQTEWCDVLSPARDSGGSRGGGAAAPATLHPAHVQLLLGHLLLQHLLLRLAQLLGDHRLAGLGGAKGVLRREGRRQRPWAAVPGQQRAGGARCQADDHAANCPTSGPRGPWERRSAAIHRPRRAHVPRRPAALTTLA